MSNFKKYQFLLKDISDQGHKLPSKGHFFFFLGLDFHHKKAVEKSNSHWSPDVLFLTNGVLHTWCSSL